MAQGPSKKPATAGPVFGHPLPALDAHYAKPTWPKPPKRSGQACVDDWEFWGGSEGVGMSKREGMAHAWGAFCQFFSFVYPGFYTNARGKAPLARAMRATILTSAAPWPILVRG